MHWYIHLEAEEAVRNTRRTPESLEKTRLMRLIHSQRRGTL